MNEKDPTKLVREHRQRQNQKNALRLSQRDLIRKIQIAFEDVVRMTDVVDKWIGDDDRYDFYVTQLTKILTFCKDLGDNDLDLINSIYLDFHKPSTRDISERHRVVVIGNKAIKIFELPKNPYKD